MAYTPNHPGGWQDEPSEETPITAAALDHIEDGIVAAAAVADAAQPAGDYATTADLTTGLADKADVGHTHPISDVVDLASALADKQDAGDYATTADLQVVEASIPTTPGEVGAATAAQGALADTAVQPATLEGYATDADLQGVSEAIPTEPGDIGAQPAGSYATAAQGALADTAVQPADLDDLVSSATVQSVVTLTQAEYDALTPDPATLYFVTD